MSDYFVWKGQRSTEYGVHVTEQPIIVRPSERAVFTPVPGRSGTLTTLQGEDVYDDFILPIDCAVRDLSRLGEISAWLRGASALTTPEQPGGFYNARVVNQIEFAKIMRGRANRRLTVTFRCNPFWYVADAPDIVLTASGGRVTNPGDVASEPVITVTGSGDIILLVGYEPVELEGVSGSITLDTRLMEAYNGADPQNNKMIGEFPRLPPGASTISWTGNVSRVTITPNWRYLLH